MAVIEQKIVLDSHSKKMVGYNVFKGTENINMTLADNDKIILNRVSCSIAETDVDCPVLGFQQLEAEANGDFISLKLETNTTFSKNIDCIIFLKKN